MNLFAPNLDPFPFAIDANYGNGPERNQIHSRHKFSRERRQKFPMPAQQVKQERCDHDIENGIGRGETAFGKQGKHKYLKRICGYGQNHRGSETRAWRAQDGFFHIDGAVHPAAF